MNRPFLVALIAALLPSIATACQPSSLGQIANALLSADAVFIARPSKLEMIEIDPDQLALDDSEKWKTGSFRLIKAKFEVEEVWKGSPPEEVLSMNNFFCGGFWAIGVPQIFTFTNDEKSLVEAWELPADLETLPFLSLPDWAISSRRSGFADHRVFFERVKDGKDPVKAAAGLAALRLYFSREVRPLD